jgi:hypothetical protein
VDLILISFVIFLMMTSVAYGLLYLFDYLSSAAEKRRIEFVNDTHVWTMSSVVYTGFCAVVYLIFAVVAAVESSYGHEGDFLRRLFFTLPTVVIASVAFYLFLRKLFIIFTQR